MVAPLAPDRLARRTDPAVFTFSTTADLPPLEEVVGQDRAVEALSFGVEIRQSGFNLYAMGPEGIGKYTLVRQVLLARAASEPVPADWCYVHNFADPRRPRVLTLPAGEGRRFRDRIAQLDRELRAAIPAAFESEEYRNRREAVETALKERRDGALVDFERRAAGRGIALLRTPIGVGLGALKDGKILERGDVEQLPEAERERLAKATGELEEELGELVQRTFPRWEREARATIREAGEEVTQRAVGHLIDEVRAGHRDDPAILAYLDALEADVVANAEEFLAAAQPREGQSALAARLEDGALFRRYQVNLVVDHGESTGAPVVFEDLPTQPNLLGRVEHAAQFGALVTDFSLIRAGALHRANGGYLVLDARQLLMQPFAWEELKRALRAGEIRIESLGDRLGLRPSRWNPSRSPSTRRSSSSATARSTTCWPSWIRTSSSCSRCRWTSTRTSRACPRPSSGTRGSSGTLAARGGMRPLEPGAVAAVIDQAARLAGDAERLSMHMRRVSDLVREADERAGKAGHDRVSAADIEAAVVSMRRRASRIQERSLAEIQRGTVLVSTSGAAVGVANGLSVIQLGEAEFGRPTRISASVSLGDGELVDIEREVKLGGPIHSKGVLILGGFLGARYGRTRPLSIRASLVFEQSYGGVEGDSASMAEACALLSAIAEVPLRQSIAMTGSMNQGGEVQPIGGVNEKIEGFFDVCSARGLDGSHGVIVPATNVPHLMLRSDIVEAAASGRFSVWAVRTVDEALALLTGLPAGERLPDGTYPADSMNGRVEAGLDALVEQVMSFAVRTEVAKAAARMGPKRGARGAGGAKP